MSLHGMIASQCIYVYCAVCTPLLLYVVMYIIWMYYVYLLFVISIVCIFYKYWYWSVNKTVSENTLLLLLLSLLVWHPSTPCNPVSLQIKLKQKYNIYHVNNLEVLYNSLSNSNFNVKDIIIVHICYSK